MINIGIIGRARSGKDTAGAWLVENLGYERVAFADPIREAALRLNPIVDVDVALDGGYEPIPIYSQLSDVVGAVGWERAKENPEVRRILQEYGMTIRTVDPNFWLRAALAKVTEINERGQSAVITDVRFPNEAESLRRSGFQLLYIERPGIEHLDHESEGALTADDADVVIPNTGSLERFQDLVRRVADVIAVPQRYAIGTDVN